jgi:exopolyphosphatase/guanosine-5'-triphosphate,3'-diphosphate pyrophosphatase
VVFAEATNTNVIEHQIKQSDANLNRHRIVRRAAFDIGSGQIKMQVSDVDLKMNRIANTVFTDNVRVALRDDLAKSPDGRLSEEIQNQMIDTISQLIKKTAPFHPEEYHAIATESLRLAKNADIFLARIKKETGLSVTIISQDEEGVLGFISATNEANVDPDKAISWDLGGGSFQITAKCGDQYTVYQGKLGKVPFKIALLKMQGKEMDRSPNPISKQQLDQALLFIIDTVKEFPFELHKKLKHPDVVVLGIGINPLWGMQENTNYDKNRLLKEIESRLDLDDAAIMCKDSIDAGSSVYVVNNLILAYGIMDELEISEVHYVGTKGANSVGTLLSPKYWKNSPTSQ